MSGSDAVGVFDVDGERVSVAKGALIYPLSVRYGGLAGATAATSTVSASPTSAPSDVASTVGVFLSESDPGRGWLVQSNATDPVQLPDAALGKTTGTVFVGGVLRDKFWVRKDRQDDVLLSQGDSVAGTPLRFTGVQDDRVPTATAFFTDAAGVVYFGNMGEGGSDGVLY
ncbi:hypothetical protein ACFEMC_09045 [Kineococcus sp. DHX-1]|uniref:hypothetical protein n=1 Tax=Kineococcus sp. DHX-1 TaxID=3349638 RepID=UPI0036D372BF